MKRFYEVPKQVKWFNFITESWIGGIAYHDVIICGCCGSVLPIEVFEKEEIIDYEDWVNIDIEIRGDLE